MTSTKKISLCLTCSERCKAAIDLGSHVIVAQGLELPATLREIFATLEQHRLITPQVSQRMQKMCGFRNIAVHEYQTLSRPILMAILTGSLRDLEDFYSEVLTLLPPERT
jgi:uncharacterized protein YutE (UPF0331/DUF86 family)